MEKVKKVKLATQHIRIDGGTQPRAELNESVVDEYAEAMASGAEFPPCIVYYDGSNNWLADGFHRYHAAAKVKKNLLCEQRPGTRRDAVLYSVGANGTHGLRRTNADKRKAVETLLNDDEWKKNSGRWIAEHCGVSPDFVSRLRSEQVSSDDTSDGVVIGRDGKEYPASIAQPKAVTGIPVSETNPTLDNAHNDDIFDDYDEEPEEDSGEIDGYGRPISPFGVPVETSVEVVNADLPEEPKPTTPERLTQSQEDALSDEEWLNTLPLHHKLIEEKLPHHQFDEAALLWRRLRKINNTLKREVNAIINTRNTDAYTMRVRTYIDTPHPAQWKFTRDGKGGFLLW